MAQSDQFGEIDLIYIDSVEAAPGKDISVRVNVRNDEKLNSISIPLTYDENFLTLKAIDYTGSRVEYVDTKILNPSSVEQINGHFVVAVAVIFEEPLAVGDGVIFTVVFEVAETAIPGTSSIIDSLYYPPGGQLVFAEDSTSSAIYPAFEAGQVLVVNANRAPVFAPLSDQYVIEGDSMILDIVITDPDYDHISLAVTDKPTGATFIDNGNGTGRFAWVPAYVGPYSSDGSPFMVGFWAGDGELSVEKTINIQVVNKNRQPVITAEQQFNILAGDNLSFVISATDPDFEDIIWSSTGLPSGAVFDGNNPGTFNWQTAVTDSGATVVGFIAADPQGYADTALVTVNIDANTLYMLTMDSRMVYPGEKTDFLVSLDNKLPVGSFNLLINHDPVALVPTSVTNIGTRSENFEYFNYVLNENGYAGNIRLVGIADLALGNIPPLEAGDGAVVKIEFQVTGDLDYAGLNFPIRFQFLDGLTGNDNTLTDSVGDKITQEEIAYNDGSILIRNLGEIKIGDINLNGLAYEISDVIYFTNYFINPFAYKFTALQYANSDVNRDGFAATVADLVTLINAVISGSPTAKAAVDDNLTAAVSTEVGERRTAFNYRADFKVGGVLMVLETEQSISFADIKNVYEGMTVDYRQEGGELRLLIYDMNGTSLPSGDNELFTVEGLTEFEIREIDLSSAGGQYVAVSFGFAEPNLPESFTLYQNFPNPFNPETNISFALPGAFRVQLAVYNILGERVKILADGVFAAGQHELTWDGRNDDGQAVSSGIYFYRLVTSEASLSKKMMLLK